MMKTYRQQAEKDQLSDYLNMILIFTSAALKAPQALEMLSNIANPQHIQSLFKLLIEASPKNKLTILAILDNLVRVKVPDAIYDSALDNLNGLKFEQLSIVTFNNRLVQLLFNLAL
jgi:hypothetical protein